MERKRIIMTKQELAEELKVSVPTIDNWRRKTDIPHMKIGRAVRFDLNEVYEFIKKQPN